MINAKIYYSFNYFMTQVINQADNITRQNHERGFEELFNKDQVLINVVLDVGEKYKNHWENANNNPVVIDKLLSDAANELYRKASQHKQTHNVYVETISVNIYYSFNDFMTQVIEKADSIAQQNHNRGLEELFAVSNDTYKATIKLISNGWHVFLAVVALLALGWGAFLIALAVFGTTPIGIIVMAIFGAGTILTIKKMYKDKVLPNAVKDVGEKYKSRWENADNNPVVIDKLLSDAASELYRKAYQQASDL